MSIRIEVTHNVEDPMVPGWFEDRIELVDTDTGARIDVTHSVLSTFGDGTGVEPFEGGGVALHLSVDSDF